MKEEISEPDRRILEEESVLILKTCPTVFANKYSLKEAPGLKTIAYARAVHKQLPAKEAISEAEARVVTLEEEAAFGWLMLAGFLLCLPDLQCLPFTWTC